jgi:hypothetical protein
VALGFLKGTGKKSKRANHSKLTRDPNWTRGSLKPKSLGPAWATQEDLHLKRKKKCVMACTPIIPALGKWRHENHKFKASPDKVSKTLSQKYSIKPKRAVELFKW